MKTEQVCYFSSFYNFFYPSVSFCEIMPTETIQLVAFQMANGNNLQRNEFRHQIVDDSPLHFVAKQ